MNMYLTCLYCYGEEWGKGVNNFIHGAINVDPEAGNTFQECLVRTQEEKVTLMGHSIEQRLWFLHKWMPSKQFTEATDEFRLFVLDSSVLGGLRGFWSFVLNGEARILEEEIFKNKSGLAIASFIKDNKLRSTGLAFAALRDL